MKRITQLDGVRGVAILLVLIWHYVRGQLVPGYSIVAYRASNAFSLAWSGVDLFFVLSGFLIAGILLDHRNTSNFFRIFYIRRVCRIFPLYFLLVALFFVVSIATPLAASPSFEWLFHQPFPFWSYATFTQNFFMGARGDFGPNWLGITWSLAVEEQFYLIVPLLIYFLPRRALVCIFSIGILGAPFLRQVSPGFHAFVDTPWRADSLLSGALLAVLVRWPPFVSGARSNRTALVSVFGVFLVGAVVLTRRPELMGGLNHLWLAALYSTFVLIAFVGNVRVVGPILESRVLVWFGRLSYGVYMFHQAVSGMLYGVVRGRGPQMRTLFDAGITLAALFITLGLAMLSYRFFETPFLRFGHRFRHSQKGYSEPSLQALQKRA
jgi:peptidoglycan/LPS O-acetylase OafA/YrhL